MTVTEGLMTLGSWSLRLKPETPYSVRAALGVWGHVVVTPTRVRGEMMTDATILTAQLARYSGLVMRIGRNELSGSGLARWLGDESGKGPLMFTSSAETRTMQDWLSTRVFNLSPGLTSGTISATPTATMTMQVPDQTIRSFLDKLCEFFQCEWRVKPHGYLDVGPANELFTTTPTAVVTRHDIAGDITYAEVQAAELNAERNAEDYATGLYYMAQGEGGATNKSYDDILPPYLYYALNGNGLVYTRIVDAPTTDATDLVAARDAAMAKYVGPVGLRTTVKLSSDIYDIGRTVKVGDTIYVFDPDEGLVDSAVQVTHQGRRIFPLAQRVLAYTWPIDARMGVFFRSATSPAVWTDLTPWFVPEDATTSIEVGAVPKVGTAAAEGRTQARALAERLSR